MLRQNRYLNTACLLGLLLLAACHDRPADPVGASLAWLGDPDNGLVVERTTGEMRMRVQFLPESYFSLLQRNDTISGIGRSMQIENTRQGTLFFLLSFALVDSSGSVDPMGYRLTSEEEIAQRTMDLNFSVQEMATLKHNRGEVPAALAILQNTHELSGHRDILLAFPGDAITDLEHESISLILDDRIFDTGIQSFAFEGGDLVTAERTIKQGQRP